MKESILLVDDKEDMLTLLKRIILQKMDADIQQASNGSDAISIVSNNNIDLVIADIRMPEMDGITLLKKINNINKDIVVIILTAFGTVEMAVEALKIGAYDFLTKPIDNDRFIHTVKKAIEFRRIIKEKKHLENKLKQSKSSHEIIGTSDAIQNLIDKINIVASTEETVLITGDTGTGKELAARTIHKLSKRSQAKFVAVNCPALPESILESELFGYKKGAFTSAATDKKGLFESANGGTIFLDEIGDIPIALQTKLLRVLQEKEIKPLGDTKSVKVDVRVLASTNQDLEKKIQQGLFRDDLFYRLNVITIQMPALNERLVDVRLLAEQFLIEYAVEYGKDIIGFSEDALSYLTSRTWKGNVRELQNVVKRSVIFSKDSVIERQTLEHPPETSPCPGDILHDFFSLDYRTARKKAVEHFTVQYIQQVLQKTAGNVTHAARIAGIERQSLQHLLKKYNINSQEFRNNGRE